MKREASDGRTYEIFTREILIEKGIGGRVAEVAGRHLGADGGPVAIIVDDNTLAAAGREVMKSFDEAGRKYSMVHLHPQPGKEMVICDDVTMDATTAALSDAQVVATVSVGSGTISDLGKMSSHRLQIPSVSVATAPSNNGYTSAIAAILNDGFKTTQPCTPATAVYADPEILRNAPYRMIASGIGDLYSKPVSNADWRLSYRLNDSFFSPIVMEIVDAGNTLLEGVAEKLPARDFAAVANLTGAIMLSGLGMQAAGSSGPASGGEHLVSHYLDMTADLDGEPRDFHGCQVAVGTIVTVTLYDRFLRLTPESIDIDSLVDRLPTWESYRTTLQTRFGALADAVLKHAEKGYPTATQLRARLDRLVSQWEDIASSVGETLRPPADLAAELDSADCPTRFPQLGVNRARAKRATSHCKDIRNRYTILHLLWELGLLDAWCADIVEAQFG